MIVEDFLCLGRTVPECSKKYGHKVCMAGYSRELNQLMRVYPLPVKNKMRANHLYRLKLKRNTADSREESWQLADRDEVPEPHAKISASDKRKILQSLVVPVNQLNEPAVWGVKSSYRSLAVISPESVSLEYKRRRDCSPTQLDLFEGLDAAFGADSFALAPYLKFDSHTWQLREWGCYEFMRNYPSRCRELSTALGLAKPQHRPLLLVGNMANHRTTWLVIAVAMVQRESQQLELQIHA